MEEGLRPGMRLADARALLPDLVTRPADPEADRRALGQLVLWCIRFTPWSAVDGDSGILLDITGCAHLHGGEEAMIDAIASRLSAFGIEARPGLADTPGAAWAVARFADGNSRITAPGCARSALAPLPVEALRITPGTSAALRRLGLTTIGALAGIPRAALSRRFTSAEIGESVLLRLDQAFGDRDEPISPLTPPPVFLEVLKFNEPLLEPGGLEMAADRMTAALATRLRAAQRGARALSLWFFRVDGTTARCDIATSQATCNASHFLRLFAERLGTVDPGFGVEAAALHATCVEPLEDRQPDLLERSRTGGDLGLLVDRLATRLGADAVFRLEPVDSHIPERAQRAVAAGPAASRQDAAPVLAPRPFRLLAPPEEVRAGAETPDGPPLFFTWRRTFHRIVRAAGPERISPEWWIRDGNGDVRDYYRVEDTEGHRYWLYRAGLYGSDGNRSPRWFLHGFYG